MKRKVKNHSAERGTKDFVNSIVEISGGYFTTVQLDELFELIETEKQKFYSDSSSENNLLRIVQGMYNKRTFLEECIRYPHYVEIITAISTHSNYLTDILVRNPELFYWVVNPSTLKLKLDIRIFSGSLTKMLQSYNSFPARVNALRLVKRKEILRIGLKDILGMENLKTVTEELSILAKGITSNLFNTCYNEIIKKYSIQKPGSKYCLIALGKLGGNELNYSSDIDLMIFYDKNTKVSEKKDYHEFLTEVIRLFIQSAASITDAGFIYRVDFRLRPDGKNSSLCNSSSSYLNYYESRGEDWERQMLIKADFVCGDKTLYNNFFQYLSPFIYPATFSISPLEQIRSLKSDIENNLRNDENIKLNQGGIRDIEFSVQALQLLNGGKLKEIRSPNTLEAIGKLEENKLLSSAEAEALINAYTFYRKTEHYLQLMNNTQTHIIPEDTAMLNKLSSYLGFNSISAFRKKLFEHRNSVLNIYKSITGEKALKINTNQPARTPGPLSQPKENRTEKYIRFNNKSKAVTDLDYLRGGKGLLGQKQFDKKSIAAFQKIEHDLFTYLAESQNPDLVLQNFVRVMRNVEFPSIWYAEFLDKNFFKSFLTICEYSQRSIDLFSEDKDLREDFLTRKVFERLSKEKRKTLNTKKFLFSLLCQFTLKIIHPDKVPELMKYFFAEKIKIYSDDIISFRLQDYFIASLGSFGSGEMNFASDIDLIFVVSNIDASNRIENEFQSFLLKLKKEFYPFEVDCRLRPEGKSSQLVWELSSYREYLEKRARTWELQSLCKLNFISGSKTLFNRFSKAVKEEVADAKRQELKKDILEMRKKLYPQHISGLSEVFNFKKSRGGVTDIEFVLQFLLLSDPGRFSSLKGKRDKQIIEKLSGEFNLLRRHKNNLIEGCGFLKELEMVNQNIFNVNSRLLVIEKEKMKPVLSFLGFHKLEDFRKHLSGIIKLNQTLFQKLIPDNKQ